MNAVSYRSSPVFTEITLPSALRSEHSTKEGVWAVIEVLEGELLYAEIDPPSEQLLTPGKPAVVSPQVRHYVTAIGHLRMRIDFYREAPTT